VHIEGNNRVLQYRVNTIHQNRPTDASFNDYLQVCDSLHAMKTHCTNCERLALLPRFYAMGRLSNTGDGFQSGYRWLSVRTNGPSVARSLCRRETKSCGLAAILASSSDTGMYLTSSFFPVFSSYALNTSLNDYGFVSCQTPSESECQVDVTLLSPAMVKEQFFSFSDGRCVKT
jgi:hypothetical protein